MNFTEVIKNKLGYLFNKYGFTAVDEMTNYINFESKYLSIAISYSHYEHANYLSIGEKNNVHKMVNISNKVLERFFNSKIELASLSTEIFADTLATFLENEANSIILGDINEIEKLYQFQLVLSKEYNEKLFAGPTCLDADKE